MQNLNDLLLFTFRFFKVLIGEGHIPPRLDFKSPDDAVIGKFFAAAGADLFIFHA